MRIESITAIKCIAQADTEASPQQIQSILAACKQTVTRRTLVNARTACEILGVSRPSLRRYCQSGKIGEVRLSPRKVRFDLSDVERLAYRGCEV